MGCNFCPGGRGLWPFCPKCRRVAGVKDKRDNRPTPVRDGRTHEQRHRDEQEKLIESARQRSIDKAIELRNKAIRRSEPTEVGDTNWLGNEHSDPASLELESKKQVVESVNAYYMLYYQGQLVHQTRQPYNCKNIVQAREWLEKMGSDLADEWVLRGQAKLHPSNKTVFLCSADKINGFRIKSEL